MLFEDAERTNFSSVLLSDCRIMLVDRKEIEGFVEKNHYSGNINGVTTDYCFALRHGNDTLGAMIYGRMAMAGQWKRFSDTKEDVVELRRLCCVDNTPKNTESYFIARTLKWLAKNTPHRIVVSYADQEHGHTGIIYRAANFDYMGFSKGARVIELGGRRYHDKAIRTMHKGQLKDFAVRIIRALENGTAEYKQTAGKHCFVYALKKKKARLSPGLRSLPSTESAPIITS